MAKMYKNGYPYLGWVILALATKSRRATLAQNLKLLLQALGLNYTQAARRVQTYCAENGIKIKFGGKYGCQMIWKYVNQVCSPKLDNLIAICATFNVNPLWLCGYDPDNVGKMPQLFTLPAGVNGKTLKTEKPVVKAPAAKRVAKVNKTKIVAKVDPAVLIARLTPDMTIGERIKLCRQICELSQRGLSARCQMTGTAIHQATISSYERGKAKPSVQTVRILAKAMKLPYKLVSGAHAKSLRNAG